MYRVSILKGPLSMYLNIIRLSMTLRLMSYLFQKNKSYGVKTICIHPLMYVTVRHHVTSGTQMAQYLSGYCLTVFTL
jgi:hypothetical protein